LKKGKDKEWIKRKQSQWRIYKEKENITKEDEEILRKRMLEIIPERTPKTPKTEISEETQILRLIWGQEQRDKVELFVNFRTKVNWTDRKFGWVVQTTIFMKIFKTIGHAIKVNLIVILCLVLCYRLCVVYYALMRIIHSKAWQLKSYSIHFTSVAYLMHYM